MSRSVRGGKGPGFEYWTARPGNTGGGHYRPDGNTQVKRATHKAERRQGKQAAREGA